MEILKTQDTKEEHLFLLKDNCKPLNRNSFISVCYILSIFNIFLLSNKTFSQESIYSGNEASFDLIGFATLNGGTTGGAGGTEVVVSTFSELEYYAEEESTPCIIKINGTITGTGSVTGGDYDGRIRVGSNKTIIGIGSTAFLNGVGFTISNHSNIIIRNLTIFLVSIADSISVLEVSEDIPDIYSAEGDEGRAQILVNGGDLISIYGESNNIWIDHCELYSEDPRIQPNKDLYDGIIDIRNQCAYITISWNYIHDHWKTHLVGSSPTDAYDRKITFHHNHWERCNTRHPLYRFGNGHIFNNYYDTIYGSGASCKEGACVRIEGNYFEDSNDPIGSFYSGAEGFYDINDNSYINCTGNQPVTSNCTFDPPYSYTLDPVDQVKNIVLEGVGVGKLDNLNSIEPRFPERNGNLKINVYPNPTSEYLIIHGIQGAKVRIIDTMGMTLKSGIFYSDNITLNISDLKKGVYVIEVRNKESFAVKKVIIK